MELIGYKTNRWYKNKQVTQNKRVTQEGVAAQDDENLEVAHPLRGRLPYIYYLIGVAVLAIILGGLLFLGRMVDVEAYRFQIISSLENITGQPVSVGKVAFSPTGGLFTLELQDLEIHTSDQLKPPFLLVKRVQVGMTPISFIRKIMQNDTSASHPQLEISSLTLIRPQINIIQGNDSYAWLMHWVQEMTQKSDRKIELELGLGLTDISIGSIKIQSGILTLLNWERPDSRTLVFDRIQGEIHSLSPNRASPVSLLARLQSIPFTLTGQIGPLPKSLDLAEMPVLLSLEAKSAKLPKLNNVFTNASTHKPHTVSFYGERGYFSTMFYGSLQTGMRTSSRLELDSLVVEVLPIIDERTLLPASWKKVTSAPMDWAFRQKSVLHRENGSLFYQIEELFLYLDRKPILDVKGVVGHSKEGLLDLKVSTLESIDMRQFPSVLFPYLSGDSVQGSLHIHGSWPDSIALDANLDLSGTAFFFPPPGIESQTLEQESHTLHTPPLVVATASWLKTMGVSKKTKTPLFLNLKMVYEKTWNAKLGREERSLLLEDMVLSLSPTLATKEPGHHLHLSGTLQPVLHLNLVGEWELSLLKDFLPKERAWNASGLARMQMTLSATHEETNWYETDRQTDIFPVAEGYLRSDGGHVAGIKFENFFTRIKLKEDLLHLSGLELQVGSGRLDGYLMADLSKPQASYQALFAFAGIAVEDLAQTSNRDSLHVEGLAFGQGDIRGSLDDNYFSVEPYSGNFHLEIEPGRVTGIHGAGVNGDLFLRPPVDVQVIFGHANPNQQGKTGQENVEQGKTGQVSPSIKQENLANPKKAFYWNRLETDITLHNSFLRFGNLHLKSGGLQIFGNGEWRLSGKHWFDLMVRPSLQKSKDNHFSAWVQGDGQQTVYQPRSTSRKGMP